MWRRCKAEAWRGTCDVMLGEVVVILVAACGLEVQGCGFWRSDEMRGSCWWHATRAIAKTLLRQLPSLQTKRVPLAGATFQRAMKTCSQKQGVVFQTHCGVSSQKNHWIGTQIPTFFVTSAFDFEGRRGSVKQLWLLYSRDGFDWEKGWNCLAAFGGGKVKNKKLGFTFCTQMGCLGSLAGWGRLAWCYGEYEVQWWVRKWRNMHGEECGWSVW